jgi:hypothetical protein
VKVLQNIRLGIANRVLNYRLKKNIHQKKTFNLKSAETIEVVFNASDTRDFTTVKKFVESLRLDGKKVQVLGFVDSKTIPQSYYLLSGFSFFCQKDLNMLMIPKKEKTLDFINRTSDLLINLNLSDSFPVDYICSLKKAYFKIGKYTDEKSYLDMMITIQKNQTVEYLIEQIIHYLSIIKSKEAQLK